MPRRASSCRRRFRPSGWRATARGRPKLRRYPGLKEEYYLSDFEPDPAVPERLGVDPGRRLVVVRTPPEVSLYHRHGNPLFVAVLERLGRDESVHAVVLPRTDEQRRRIAALALPSLLLPDRAVDAQSLIAAADVVVSAGGTMNREAIALGVPVYTTFGGRLGAVDEQLIREGRLAHLRDPDRPRPRASCRRAESARAVIRLSCSTYCSASTPRTSTP